jgi:hypothetical protein
MINLVFCRRWLIQWPTHKSELAIGVAVGCGSMAVIDNELEAFSDGQDSRTARNQNKVEFAPDAVNLSTKFSLLQEVVFCKRCVISNQRPNSAVEYALTKESKKKTIHFDHEGICDTCRFAEKKNATIDLDERERRLRDLLDQHRSRDGKYDCILPGSGGKDSFYASHILRKLNKNR